MTSQLPLAEGRHNHPPRCCCDDDPEQGGTGPCVACPDHGALSAGIECPQCHTPIGRPHTDYCTLSPWRVWYGVLPSDTKPCAYPHLNHGDGRGCDTDDCPHHSTP